MTETKVIYTVLKGDVAANTTIAHAKSNADLTDSDLDAVGSVVKNITGGEIHKSTTVKETVTYSRK